MQRSIHLLATRTLTAAQKQLFSDSNILLTDKDFIEISLLELPTALNTHSHLLFTSKNAVKSVVKKSLLKLIHYPVFCVGSETRKLLETYGFDVVASADYAHELAPIIIEKHPDVSITFFSGNLRHDTLPEQLKSAGIPLNEYQVYSTQLHPIKMLTDTDSILFFSPSAVKSYLQNNRITTQTCFCIGTTTAAALKEHTSKIEIAARPTIQEVLQQCIKYYQ